MVVRTDKQTKDDLRLKDNYYLNPAITAVIRQLYRIESYDPEALLIARNYQVDNYISKQLLQQEQMQLQDWLSWLRFQQIRQIEQEAYIQQAIACKLAQQQQAEENKRVYDEIMEVQQMRRQNLEEPSPAQQEAERKKQREHQRYAVYQDPRYDSKTWQQYLLGSVKRLASRLLDMPYELGRSLWLMKVSQDPYSTVANDITPEQPAFFSFDESEQIDLIVTRSNDGQLAVLSPRYSRFTDELFWQQAFAVLQTLGASRCEQFSEHLTQGQYRPSSRRASESYHYGRHNYWGQPGLFAKPAYQSFENDNDVQPKPSAPVWDEDGQMHSEYAYTAKFGTRANDHDLNQQDSVMPQPSAPDITQLHYEPDSPRSQRLAPTSNPTREQYDVVPTAPPLDNARDYCLYAAPIVERALSQSLMPTSSRARADLRDMNRRYRDHDLTSNYSQQPF